MMGRNWMRGLHQYNILPRKAHMYLFLYTLYLCVVSLAQAAWPDSFEHRIAAMEALRYDLAMPGVPYDSAQVLAKYKVACDKNYFDVCHPEVWQQEKGGNAMLAMDMFESKCTKTKSPLACVVVGFAYGMVDERVDAKAKNPQKAYNAFYTACEEKAYGPGCTYLGDMYAVGVGVAEDQTKAEEYYKEACSAKDIWGCHRLADLYGETKTHSAERLGLYTQSCQNGYVMGCIAQATVMQEKASTQAQWKFIAEQLEIACRYGQMDKCANLAGLYETGKGVRRSLPTANALYKSTCLAKIPTSCHALGQLHLEMNEYKEAAKTFFDACEGGYAPSCTRYGALALTGKGVEKNASFALRFMNRGCDAGDQEGCLVLAESYLKGEGIERNLDKAKQLAQQTCDSGYGRGCYAMAMITETEKIWGSEGNSSASMTLYDKACSLGDGRGCAEFALREYSAGKTDKSIIGKLDIGCTGEDVRACLVLGQWYAQSNVETALPYWLHSCELQSMDACLEVGKYHQTKKELPQAAEYFERVCNLGDDRGCVALDPIAFAGKFEGIVRSAFLTNLCQVWARPYDDTPYLLADAKGAQINLYSGNYAGSTVSIWHLEDSVELGQLHIGKSNWNVGGRLPKAEQIWGNPDELQHTEQKQEETASIWGEEQKMDWSYNIQHIEEWDPKEGSVSRDFPKNITQLHGDKGDIAYWREEEELHSVCALPLQQQQLYVEHCSEIQSMIIGYILADCSQKTKETQPNNKKQQPKNDDSYFYE